MGRKSKKENSPERLCSRLWTPSSHQPVHPTNHFVSHFKTSTKLVVLEQSQSAESKLVSPNQVWSSPSPRSWSPLKSNQSRCTTNLSQKPDLVIMLVSTSRTSPSRTSDEKTLPLTPRTTQPRKQRLSTLKSSFSTTPVKLEMVTPQSWIATPPIS